MIILLSTVLMSLVLMFFVIKLKTMPRQFLSSVTRKVIILDEADYLNPNSTQPALRGAIEEFWVTYRLYSPVISKIVLLIQFILVVPLLISKLTDKNLDGCTIF